MSSFMPRIAVPLAALALAAALAVPAQARTAGAGQIVVVAGKAKHCKMGACPAYDLVQSISPHGGARHVLAKIRSVKETGSTEDGTVAVLSKNVAGGRAFSQVYLISPSGRRRAVFGERLQDFNATGLGISGNGRLLALSGRSTEGPSEPAKIWLVRADGTGMRRFTTGPGTDAMPALSPDGRTVAFARTPHDGTPAGRKPELYVAAVSGGEPRRLTENTIEDVNPVFSPDGRNIAFGEDGPGANAVATIRANGTGSRRVASTGGTYPDPDYSPSGRSIAFVGEVPHRRGYDTAIYTVRASGGGRALASAAFEAPGLPQWTGRR